MGRIKEESEIIKICERMIKNINEHVLLKEGITEEETALLSSFVLIINASSEI